MKINSWDTPHNTPWRSGGQTYKSARIPIQRNYSNTMNLFVLGIENLKQLKILSNSNIVTIYTVAVVTIMSCRYLYVSQFSQFNISASKYMLKTSYDTWVLISGVDKTSYGAGVSMSSVDIYACNKINWVFAINNKIFNISCVCREMWTFIVPINEMTR